ncbi:Hint domain-containing protein [Paracoccus zeaxanthinifaciens]|uniref:Hint domain-containing protein n=1 Tax=Paracoccus zeaxanthinifaciens TaxID=187400 RepID=UPI0003B50C7A|nr:Hint domain-containing protein [Paracoccus zeaxanthinifaciens]
MPVALNGVIFGQIYGDNSGGAVFDTDGDGTATQEDEFVSFTNTTSTAIDISGWQVWSDSAGGGAPDSPVDGLYHTFPAGTVIQPGETLYIVNEITGTAPSWAQEASQGGVESGAGGVSTNLLTEGSAGTQSEAIILLDPSSGDYIVFNMSSAPFDVATLTGFPGTNLVGTVEASPVQADQNAGSSYQYDAATDTYLYLGVFVPCFTPGAMIATAQGDRSVESLKVGDLVETLDHGLQPIRAILWRNLDFAAGADPKQKPVEFKPGSLGAGIPERSLILSPQHRIAVTQQDGSIALAPAKGLEDRPLVRRMTGCRSVRYVHLLFDGHVVIRSDGAWTESFLHGQIARKSGPGFIGAVARHGAGAAPYRVLRVAEARDLADAALDQTVMSRADDLARTA